MELKKKMKDISWYLADKLIVPATTLVGIGAARAVDDRSVLEGIVHAAKFPYDLLVGSGFVPEMARTFIDLGDNVIEHPKETIGCLAGGYVIGRVAKYLSERKRLKEKYQSE